ncbi:hypothetical protein [Falsiroseomonas sp. CW058]|uniref:hypothetical protein n=1 Tax=Falsiroseomonas sp. CW058 TaxID=3388664 RepID=UPI003D31C0AA
MASKRPSVVASGLLARPGAAPARTTPVEDLPRPAPVPPPAAAPAPAAAKPPERAGRGIKAETVGTTVYLLPREHKRIRRLALDLDIPSVHELLLTGLDRLLAERGEPPVERYSPPRPRKG